MRYAHCTVRVIVDVRRQEWRMSDFDFNKPYGSDWKRKVGIALGATTNGLVLLGHTTLFMSAISVLWGWYVVGVISCLVLVAWAFDSRRDAWPLARGRVYSKTGERAAAIYCFTLVLVAVAVNLTFLVLYSLGRYHPPLAALL